MVGVAVHTRLPGQSIVEEPRAGQFLLEEGGQQASRVTLPGAPIASGMETALLILEESARETLLLTTRPIPWGQVN